MPAWGDRARGFVASLFALLAGVGADAAMLMLVRVLRALVAA
jgi:hypothetical protein